MSDRFRAKKQSILNRLSVPDEEYADCSPKGSIDESIRVLVDEINNTTDFATTSSCSGRISVFLEGSTSGTLSTLPGSNGETTIIPNNDSMTTKWTSSKGGGRWLFTSHHPVKLDQYSNPGQVFECLGFPPNTPDSFPQTAERLGYVHFKFEPMILHILTATPERAQLALNAAMSAGFRESGISSLFDNKGRPTNPMVAVRSSGLGIDSIIGFQYATAETSQVFPTVSESYLRTLIDLANERFRVNVQRMERFRSAFLKLVGDSIQNDGCQFEPAALRKERMRREGFLRREALRASVSETDDLGNGQRESAQKDDADGYFGDGLFAASPG